MKNWTIIANEIDGRTAKQCRERWCNHLDPSIIKGNWTEEEDALILQRQKEMGNKWSKISKMLLGRTENAVKVRWKALDRAAKKAIALAKLGVDASKKNNANRSSNRRRSSKKKTTKKNRGSLPRRRTGSTGPSFVNNLVGLLDNDDYDDNNNNNNNNNITKNDMNNSLDANGDGIRNNNSLLNSVDDPDFSNLFNSNDEDMMIASLDMNADDMEDDDEMVGTSNNNNNSNNNSNNNNNNNYRNRNSLLNNSRNAQHSRDGSGKNWNDLMSFGTDDLSGFDVTDVFADD